MLSVNTDKGKNIRQGTTADSCTCIYDIVSCSAESIAFYGGEAREQGAAQARMGSLVNYMKRKIAWTGGLSLWTNAYSYVTMLIPPLLTAPRYFAGEVEFGVITQVLYHPLHEVNSFLICPCASLALGMVKGLC